MGIEVVGGRCFNWFNIFSEIGVRVRDGRWGIGVGGWGE